MENSNVSAWVDKRMRALDATDWQPNTSHAWGRLQQRRRPRATVWWVAASATAGLFVIALIVPSSRAWAQRMWEFVSLKRVEVVEVNPETIESLSPKVWSNSGPMRTAADVAEASRLAGFTPVLPSSAFGTPKLTVTGSLQTHITLRKEALERDLQRAGAYDVKIPAEWDGVVVSASIQPIVIADYGQWTLTQSPHLSMVVPATVSLEHLGFVVFRLLGHDQQQATELGRRFAANPAWFLAIPREERARLKQIELKSGPAMLIQDVTDAGAPDRLTLLWSTSDRVLAINGSDQAEMIRIAESM